MSTVISSSSTLPYPTLPYPTLPYPTLPYPLQIMTCICISLTLSLRLLYLIINVVGHRHEVFGDLGQDLWSAFRIDSHCVGQEQTEDINFLTKKGKWKEWEWKGECED